MKTHIDLTAMSAFVHRGGWLRAATWTLLATAGISAASAQVITSVTAANLTNTSAVITWTTSQPASSLVNYGLTTGYGYSSAPNPALVTAHAVTLNGLAANTLYNFNVASGAVSSANFRFATLSTSPVIGDINIIYLTSTGVTINWTTDQPSTGMVNYGTSANYNSSTPVNSTLSIAHTVTLNGLTPNTTYNFAVVSAGLAAIPSTSVNQTFATVAANAAVPTVSFVASWGMTNSGAMLSWSTDLPANTILGYGTTLALGQFTPVQTTLSASHGITLTGLTAGTTYYFVAISTSAAGVTGYSTISNLTTTGPTPLVPVISKVSSSNLSTSTATITWTTDTAGTSLVNFGTTTGYGAAVLDSTMTKSHSVTLTGLAAGTRYVFQVVSANPAGVSTFAADLTGFTVWAWGDSQTLGGSDGSRNNYPAYLSIDLGVPVVNEGIGGEISTQIAHRMLATPASFGAGNCHVIWAGSNNPTQGSQILSDDVSMVNALSAPQCFLVLGVINQVVSPLGSNIYNSIISANTSLAAQFGANYLDIRSLVVQAYNPALPLDVADHARDLPPSSLKAVQTQGTITSGALDSVSCVFSVSNGTQGPGSVVIIDSETILINSMSTNLTITDCSRGYNGTAAASHAANAVYAWIDGIHLGAKGLEFVASQVASWFQAQTWPLCAGTPGVICPIPLSFTTPATFTPLPLISAVAVSNITGSSALVSWVTDQASTSLVNYGATSGYGSSSQLDPSLTTTHSVVLAGLSPNSFYNFDVVSVNSAGRPATSANSTFNTGALSAPALSGVSTTNLTPTSATILWSTSQPATAQVSYGLTSSYGSQSTASTALATSQSVTLTGLTPNTTYNYQVISANSAGNASTSTNNVFATPRVLAIPPTVDYLAFWGITNNGVTISWSTNVNANTVVAYGTTPALGQIYTNTASSATSTANHGAVLTGLTPGTKYYFVAQSTGENGATGYSATYSFTTGGTASITPSFTLNATALTVLLGSSGSSTITVTPTNGFNSSVTLAAAGWPAGITGTFQTNPAVSASTVSISVGAAVAPGSYTLTITGNGGTLTASGTISLTVSGAAGFTLSATAATGNVGSSTASSTTITPVNGFNSAVTLAASGWPAGITGAFQTNPATASSAITISVGPAVALGPYTLTVTGTSGALTKTTTIALTVTSLTSSASFIGPDISTQGTWSGTYGSDGFLIANGVSSLPSYAGLTFTGAATYTWAGLTSDVRAVQSSRGSTGRIASSYYASNSGTFNAALNLSDGATHQVAIYMLDWDNANRAQTISITDAATGTLLDSRSFTGFSDGVYGVWNIRGAVTLKVTAAVGNPVLSAIFLAPANAVSLPPGYTLNATAATATPGSAGTSTVTLTPANGFNSGVTLAASGWPAGITGTFATNPASGSSLVTVAVGAGVAPGPYTLAVSGISGTLSASTTIALTVNAAVTPGFSLSATSTTAKVSSAGASTITISPTNGFNSAVTLAAAGWPAGITGTFGTNPTSLSSIVTINVGPGVLPGAYSLTVNGVSAALSASAAIALTVSPAASGTGPSANFAGLDTATQGAWTGKYGTSGFLIPNASSVDSTFATVSVSSALTYTWTGQTTDGRALQSSAGSPTGIASAFTQYAGQAFAINLGMPDGNTHKVSLYLLDWDGTSRSETITVLDALTNTILDTQTFSGFHNGQYASWNIKGNVVIKVTPSGYASPAVSGIFFN